MSCTLSFIGEDFDSDKFAEQIGLSYVKYRVKASGRRMMVKLMGVSCPIHWSLFP